ncbi:MAG: Rpn family recombination-promoting nuclease/putative transposase, partial [Enterococcus sp.]|nr:Rpn family recombination-promoting nuclease/putative transposase [Enterococcus sp.]
MSGKRNIETNELSFTQDAVFSRVMRDPQICKEFLQAIFPQRKVERLSIVNKESQLEILAKSLNQKLETQKTLYADLEKRGVRLDVMFENDSHIYNIEMQNAKKSDLLKRARLYQSLIDQGQLYAGEKDFEKLKDVVIIFICDFDPLGQERKIYHVEESCKEDTNLSVNPGILKVFININGKTGDTSTDLTEMLQYMRKAENYSVTENSCSLVRKVDSAVCKLNLDRGSVKSMRTIEFEMGVRERYGHKQGLKEGAEQAQRQACANL